ncbi:MAG: S49 family peptidase [Vicinamibacteria bacterium]|nr:S49 family peptidase [Vicinamibacteria bacterium]
MLHDLLDPLWMVDLDGPGRAQLDMLVAATLSMASGQPPANAGAHPALPLAALAGEDLTVVAGQHTAVKGAAQGVAGQAQIGALVVIPVFGLMQQHRSWATEYGYATSTDGVLNAVQAAIADPQVAAIVLRIYSPGGTVHGIKVLSDYLLKARKVKPIWGHADSYAASCAYWLLASCERAIATPMGEVGSVGCYLVHTSYADAEQKVGIKRTVIRAGKNKADANEWEALSEEARARLQARADAAYAEFVASVAKGRAVGQDKVRNGFGEGAIVGAADAVAEGMIDDVAPFSDTLVSLARQVRTASRATGPRAASADLDLLRARADVGLLGADFSS